MQLTLKDRIIILNGVLPTFDNRHNIALKIAIAGKIRLTKSEDEQAVVIPNGSGDFSVSFKSAKAISELQPFSFTPDELTYLKARVDFIDHNGMFSEETLGTYQKIVDEPLADNPIQTVVDEEPAQNTPNQ